MNPSKLFNTAHHEIKETFQPAAHRPTRRQTTLLATPLAPINTTATEKVTHFKSLLRRNSSAPFQFQIKCHEIAKNNTLKPMKSLFLNKISKLFNNPTCSSTSICTHPFQSAVQSLSIIPKRKLFDTASLHQRRHPLQSVAITLPPLYLPKIWEGVKVFHFAHLSIEIYQCRNRAKASATIARAWLKYNARVQSIKRTDNHHTNTLTETLKKTTAGNEGEKKQNKKTSLTFVTIENGNFCDEVAASFVDGWIYPCAFCSSKTWRLGYPLDENNSHPVYLCAACFRLEKNQSRFSRTRTQHIKMLHVEESATCTAAASSTAADNV